MYDCPGGERRKRLLYRSAHRGCKEMDILLGAFAERCIYLMSDEEIAEYEKIVRLDDRVLYAYITGTVPPPSSLDGRLLKLIAGR